jgi:hypothetical protein
MDLSSPHVGPRPPASATGLRNSFNGQWPFTLEARKKRKKKMNVKGKILTTAAGLMIACMAAAAAHAQNLSPDGDIAMSPQAGLNQTDLFTVDENGRLNVFWAGTGGWQGPERIGPGIFVGGGNIKASQQFGLNQTDVFMVDQNGQLDVFWVAGGGAWQGPEKIGPAGLFLPGCYLGVSQQFGLNQTDVFAVDKNGQLDVFWAAGGGAWQGPEKIGVPEFSPGSYANLTVSRQVGLNQTDVFMVNTTGQLEVFWAVGGGAWQGPEKIGPGGFAYPQFTPIAVSQQFGLNQTDVFLVDYTGQLDVFWATGAGAWGGPKKIGAAGLAPMSFIAASQQFGLNQTDVFLIDKNYQLDVFWVDNAGAWGGPEAIGPAGLAYAPGSDFAVAQQVGLNQTDVFQIDENGNLDFFWVDGAGAWNGPVVIYQSWGS